MRGKRGPSIAAKRLIDAANAEIVALRHQVIKQERLIERMKTGMEQTRQAHARQVRILRTQLKAMNAGELPVVQEEANRLREKLDKTKAELERLNKNYDRFLRGLQDHLVEDHDYSYTEAIEQLMLIGNPDDVQLLHQVLIDPTIGSSALKQKSLEAAIRVSRIQRARGLRKPTSYMPENDPTTKEEQHEE